MVVAGTVPTAKLAPHEKDLAMMTPAAILTAPTMPTAAAPSSVAGAAVPARPTAAMAAPPALEPGQDRTRFDQPAPRPATAGAVAQASMRFTQMFGAGGWVDLFAGTPVDYTSTFGSFQDAVDSARLLSRDQSSAIGVFAEPGEFSFFLRHIDAVKTARPLDDQSAAPRGPFKPEQEPFGTESPWDGQIEHNFGRTTVGVRALDATLRAIVDGEVLPVVSERG